MKESAAPAQRRRTVAGGWLLLTSLGLGLFIAVLIFAGFWAQRRLVREIEQDRAPLASHERLTAWTVEGHLADLERELLRLAKLADLKDAVVAADRRALQEQILPPLNRLGKGPLRVSRITFYTPDGTVYLRAHAPESYGGNAAPDRPLIAEAITARRIVKGLETERGEPYLWVATPLYHQGQFIGVLEMGSSLAPVVNAIQMVTDAQVAVLLGTEAPRTAEASDAALFGTLVPLLHRQGVVGNPVRRVVAAKGNTYVVSLIPLKDFSARETGTMAIVSNATAITQILRNSSLGTVAISFVGFVLAIALLSTLARKLDKFYWDLETHVEQLRALGQVSQAVSSSLDLRQVLDSVAHHAVNLSDSDACGILEFNVARQAFDVVASYNLRDEFINGIQGMQVDPRKTAINQAAEDGRAAQTPNIVAAKDYPFRDLTLKEGFRAQLAVPMGDKNITRGVVLFRRVPGRFDDPVVNLLTALANQSQIAIDNARLFQQVHSQRIQLEIASKHKSQFLANMSHELRTPLNAILGFTELLLENAYGPVSEEMREVFEHIYNSGRHLLDLINDVLDLSKIEAGKLVLSVTDYSMKDVVQAVHTTLKPLATGKALALTVSVPPDLPRGRGDERRIFQVLLNLVGNAIKFSDTGEVRVAVHASDSVFSVSVSDTGPGIAPADQQRVFEEFQQADNSNTRKKGGTGLGLSIAKRIIELHGGRIGVDSTPGQGSTFWFTVPVRVEQETEAR